MNKNNKGFTMVELLAVITILGILAVLATPAVTKYVTRGKTQAIETMFKSSYEAAENYMMERNIIFKTGSQVIAVSELVNEQYLEPLRDPSTKERCDTNANSKVTVQADGVTAGGLVNYKYIVNIKCDTFEQSRTFPE